MDENITSYLGIKEETTLIKNNWYEIAELEQLRSIRQTVSSTRLYKIRWGSLSVLIGEEHHYESI